MLRDMIGLKRGTVKLVKHESNWKEIFEAEKDILNLLIEDYVIDIQHVGSTSIPGIEAKPIIDILIRVKSLDYIPNIVEMLESNGFIYCPQSGTDERILFVKGGEDFRTHHIHVVERKGKEWNSNILFRDYLIENIEVAREYSILKKKLAEKYPNDRNAYTEGKNDFIQDVICKAKGDGMVIFFDLDGTLLDHKNSEHLSVIKFYNYNKECFTFKENEFYELWCETSDKYFNRYLNGELTFVQQRVERIKELFQLSGINLSDAQAKRKFNEYLLDYENSWKPFKDVIPCLESLHNYRLGIISNGDLEQQLLKLEKMGIKDYFEIVITAGDVGIAKPNAPIFRIACERAKVYPQNCYYIGDDLNTDIISCNKINMKGIWINRNGEDVKISDVTVIDSLNKLKAHILEG